MSIIVSILCQQHVFNQACRNRVGGNFFPLSHHLACRSAPGGSIQIVIHATNESSLCENFFWDFIESCCFDDCLIVISKPNWLFCHPLRHSQFPQSPVSLLAGFPLFPYHNSHSRTQVLIYTNHVLSHLSISEIVNPASNDPVQSLNPFIHTDWPWAFG